MGRNQPLIGREWEQAELAEAAQRVLTGAGGLLLVAGEAGVGKTCLVEAVLAGSGLLVLWGAARQAASSPYAPVAAALRAWLRETGAGAADLGPLAAHLALVLPELGPPPAHTDQPTVLEALRGALVSIARRWPTALFLDDLQWADSATLELVATAARWVEPAPLLLVGAYRSDEVPRGHPLRRTRAGLRRGGWLREIALEPLGRKETAVLAARVLGDPPSPTVAAALYDRTQGLPLFIEELAGALAASGRLHPSAAGLELAAGPDVPLPDSLRDAVLLRTEGLSAAARKALEVAAVAGVQVDLDLVAELTESHAGLEEPLQHGLLIEIGAGMAVFRHALMREVFYGELPWPRRRVLHRQLAERLAAQDAPASEVAEHWLAAREFTRARAALLQAVEAWCGVHAYRDAARAGRRVLELWTEGEDEPGRLAVLDRLGHCAELSGDLTDAARAWGEAAAGYQAAKQWRACAEVQRRLALVYELLGTGERALAARQAAAEAFALADLPGEAAAERLAAAEHLESAGRYSAALELVLAAAAEAQRARRLDLASRALSLEGELRADLGDAEAGLQAIRGGLALALEHNLTGAAAQAYYRLALALQLASDHVAARDAYATAVTFCEAHGLSATGQVCLACLAVVLRQTGEWERAAGVCRDVLGRPDAPPPARAVAAGMLGSIGVLRGERARARGLLQEAYTAATVMGAASLELDSAGCLAMLEEAEGAPEAAVERLRALRRRWSGTEDRYFVVPAFCWGATFFAARGLEADVRACADALAQVTSATGNVEALAALAHALGECALLERDAAQAASHFGQALDLLGRVEAPYWRAHTQLRAGVALTAVGAREAAVERLTGAYRTARKLGARPLAECAAQELSAMGEPLERRLGRRAVGYLDRAGLSRRELQVLRLVSVGRTNREIGRELFLSPRTVEMYVSNILGKLECASRAEAIHRAHELGLLSTT